MEKSIITILLFILSKVLFAQIEHPVKWGSARQAT